MACAIHDRPRECVRLLGRGLGLGRDQGVDPRAVGGAGSLTTVGLAIDRDQVRDRVKLLEPRYEVPNAVAAVWP